MEWDEETFLPRRGVESRAAQQATLAGLIHARDSDPEIGDLLARVEASAAGQDAAVAADLRVWRRRHERACRVERSLVEELATVTARAQRAWAEAHAAADYALARPWLERVLALVRTLAAAIAPHLSRYDALLDDHEPGVRATELDDFFAVLRQELVPLARARAEHKSSARRRRPPLAATTARQMALCRELAAAVGFDFEAGRLDTSPHPFTIWLGPGDVRLTTRFDPDDLTAGLFATLHEAGHGIYDQGLDAGAIGRASGEPASASMHEAQARLWENVVGRSAGFWRFALPLLRRHVPALVRTSPATMFQRVNEVRPGSTRARADELTYDLHIAMRFQLERALVEGSLTPRDLPAAWNEAVLALGWAEPENDRTGCLQDGHWLAGMFGYFPTYSLGNAAAAQLFAAAQRDLGPLEDQFARGEFAPLRLWLHQHVHRHGHRHTTGEIIRMASGTVLGADSLVARLRQRVEDLAPA